MTTVRPEKQIGNEGLGDSDTAAGCVRTLCQKRRFVEGTVVSNKMQKTIVVRVDRRVQHALYQKYILKSCRYKAHDENNMAKIGDRVSLVETRPLSKEKRWALHTIIRKAGQTADANV